MKQFDTENIQPNPHLKKIVLEAIANQLRDNNPPEARATLMRLKAAGYTDKKAKEMIAAVMVEHMYNALRNQIPFDGDAYIRDLGKIK